MEQELARIIEKKGILIFVVESCHVCFYLIASLQLYCIISFNGQWKIGVSTES